MFSLYCLNGIILLAVFFALLFVLLRLTKEVFLIYAISRVFIN